MDENNNGEDKQGKRHRDEGYEKLSEWWGMGENINEEDN